MDGDDNDRHSAEIAIQRDAGVLLRQLHDGQPALPWDDFASAKAEEFD